MKPTIFQPKLKRFCASGQRLRTLRLFQIILLTTSVFIGDMITHALASDITPAQRYEHINEATFSPSLLGQTRREASDPHGPITHEPITHEPITHEPITHEPPHHEPRSQQTNNIPSPELFPVELMRLTSEALTPEDGVLTSRMISSSGLTPPSLWWTQQQVGGKTLQGWIAYPAPHHAPPYVDLVVNRQLWGLSDYLERYSFVHHFGQAAASFGYAIRVFNNVGEYLAAYPCVWSPSHLSRSQGIRDVNDIDEVSVNQRSESPSQPRSCSIIVDSSGIGVRRESDFNNF